MLKYKKSTLAFTVLLAVLLSACSGLNVGAITSQYGLSTTPAQAAAPAPVVVQTTAPNSELLASYQDVLTQIYQNVNPSVVYVEVVESSTSTSLGLPANHPQVPQTASGSGFVWDTQGHIITNNHVISGASSVTVTFSDGTVANATVVGADPNSDLAVLKVNVPQSELKPVQIADSSQVQVGQMAIAIGNPFGLSGTMTAGIISALNRSLPVGLDNPNFGTVPTYSIPDIIQTDASINPGNSGGVLVNDQGQVIGVTAAIASATQSNAGIGFVIPSKIVQMVVPSLISTGKYSHPWLGISGTTLTPELAKASNLADTQRGVIIMEVASNSPAEKAGLQGGSQQVVVNGQQELAGGDVITAVDGHAVNTFEDMVSYLFENAKPGQTVDLTILRNGSQSNVKVTLGTLPTQ